MKTMNQVHTLALSVMTAAMLLVGCGKKGSDANVEVEFVNHTVSAQKAEYEAVGIRGLLSALSLQSDSVASTPLIYQMKLVAFYMVEAIDEVTGNNQGAGTHLWVNKNCDSDLTYCGINPAQTNGYTADYFDFAQGSAAVNKEFNSYKRDTKDSQIGIGTYNYIRMDFTGKVLSDSDKTPNLKFGSQVANEVRAQNQAVLVKMDKPLVLEKGDTFTVQLAYSLDDIFYESGTPNNPPAEVGQDKRWTCAGEEAGVPCVAEAEFSPTVIKK